MYTPPPFSKLTHSSAITNNHCSNTSKVHNLHVQQLLHFSDIQKAIKLQSIEQYYALFCNLINHIFKG